MIEVDVSGAAIPRFPRTAIADYVRKAMKAVGRKVPAARGVGSVSVKIASDAEMKAINRAFRQRNKTTDILTFPADASYEEPGASLKPLGDLIISIDQARRQARAEKHALATEVRYLLLHGLIHALGFDHEADEGQMNRLELEMRSRLGLR
jgi:probable rRNA maturation factor